MRVISRKKLSDFGERHPQMRSALDSWYRIFKLSTFNSFNDLRNTFPSADRVGKLTVFNICGSKARLIAAIHFNRNCIYIREVLTHTEYDLGKWKNNK